MSFLQSLHTSTKRDYIARVQDDKPHCCEVAKQFGKDYWDGDRRYGYGGYKYDGRWKLVAEAMVKHYDLKPSDKILDIGCGKGFLLYDFGNVIHNLETYGIDISEYGLACTDLAMERCLWLENCTDLHFEDKTFDFVYSINAFHNLKAPELKQAIQEMNRVTKPGGRQYICVESWRNETEKCNLLNWQLTAESLHDTDSWKWLLSEYGYKGDVEFIYFE